MISNSLLSISPLDGRYSKNTTDLCQYFSEFALIKARLQVEVSWLKFLASRSEFPQLKDFCVEGHKWLDALINNFTIEDADLVKKYESKLNHDVKAVEVFLRDKMLAHPKLASAVEFIHFACTSEDINNLAYGLLLKNARSEVIVPKMQELVDILKAMAVKYADNAMLARTHGQPATPTTVGKEFANFAYRLNRQLQAVLDVDILGKYNGAVGNYNAHCVAYPEVDWQQQAKVFVESFGLKFNPYTTQIEPHDYISELFHSLIRFNLIIKDLSADAWGYISLNYFTQKQKPDEVGSSTMPHKVNPIDFENAEGNIGLANAVLDHMAQKLPISRFQRDLTDSTVMRNAGVGVAYSFLSYCSVIKGLNKIELNSDKITADLQGNQVILAEPIQMLLRKHGFDDAYEKLRVFTRGRHLDRDSIMRFVDSLDGVPESVKLEIREISVINYLGSAVNLSKTI